MKHTLNQHKKHGKATAFMNQPCEIASLPEQIQKSFKRKYRRNSHLTFTSRICSTNALFA